jgi:alkanesulfonate monooxygenase SsuD/methylene tetrahydromethanopterin reductase-like flavin-dependent oxidoreductase (luciferase family)
MSRVGIQIGATTPAAKLGSIAATAEALGYAEAWLAEDYFEHGGIASVAAALAATDRMPIGLGVVAAAVRHPALTAMEFATLAGIYPGRLMAGIGHGAPGWMDQMGLRPASPMGLLREAATGVRRLLAGEELTKDGEYFRFDRVKLLHPPTDPVPLYFGVHGPASLRLSGEVGDGTLLGWLSTPAYVAWARERIDEGRAKAGRTDHHSLSVLCLLSISEDGAATARQHIGKWLGPMLAAMGKSPQLATSDAGREIAAVVEREGTEALMNGPPDELLSEFVAAGNLETCARTVDRLLAAGADRVVLVPNPAGYRSTADMVDQIRHAAPLVNRSVT